MDRTWQLWPLLTGPHTTGRVPKQTLLATVGALAAILCAPPPARAAPLEVYGRLPSIEEVALSPDGSRIAFVRTEGEVRKVTVFSVADHKLLRGLRTGEQKLRGIRWADDDHLLIRTSVTFDCPYEFRCPEQEWHQMQVYDITDGKLLLVPFGDRRTGINVMNSLNGPVVVRRLQDHTVLYMRAFQTTGRLGPALVRVDLATKTSQVIRSASPGNVGWIVDNAGEVVAEELYDNSKRRWAIFIQRDGRNRPAASGQADLEIPSLLGLGPTPDTLLFQDLENGDWVWRLLSLKDGSLGAPMAERQRLGSPIEDPSTHRLVGGSGTTDSIEYVFFDAAMETAWKSILDAFPGERVRLESSSADFRKVIVQVEGEQDGFRFELVDLDTGRATSVGNVYEGVTRPFEVRRITYAASDGKEIPAYLTLPRGRPAQSLALVVLPHGGPADRDTAEFNWWSQALADQGYAVLRPNYRGSTLDWAFLSSGFGEWGKKMQTDLSDGVRYLAKEGIADPKRVCIVGASYGGYAALAGPALDPGVYRCAVSVAGIADLRRMLKWIADRYRVNHQESWSERYWDRFMGVSGPDDPRVDAISPIKHVDAITVPVLLIHGRDDTVVDFEQSRVMYGALRMAKKDVELVTLKHEDHWLSRSDTRLQMLQSVVAFLRAHNPPD